MTIMGFTGVKVFCASTSADRQALGEKVTAWLADNPKLEPVAQEVRQSSDDAYHCITIVIFYRPRPAQ